MIPRLLLRLALWAALCLAATVDIFTGAALFALLVAYPSATDIDLGYPRWLARLAWLAGLAAGSAALLERGPLGAALASTWLAYAVANLAYGGIRFLNAPEKSSAVALAEAAGRCGPVVGALAWIAARGDGAWLGFGEPITTLTVVHFHFTFGALPLTLAAWTRATPPDGRLGTALRHGALAAITLLPVAIGCAFALRPEPTRAGAIEAGLCASLAVALALWLLATRLALPATTRGRGLFSLAGTLLLVGGILGAAWSITLATGAPWTDFAGMMRTHGLLNAGATLTLTLLAARFAPTVPAHATTPAPDDCTALAPGDHLPILFRDSLTVDLGENTPANFAAARAALLDYDFYPAAVLAHRTAFAEAGRPPRVGDGIGMLLRVPLLPGFPEIRLPALTRVHLVADAPARVALGYTTTTRHYGRGRWEAEIVPDGDRLRLRIESRMTPTHPLALLGLPVYRHFQLRARRLGIARLRAKLAAHPHQT